MTNRHHMTRAQFEQPAYEIDVAGLSDAEARRVVAVNAAVYGLPDDFIALQRDDTVIIAAGMIINGKRHGRLELPDDFEVYGLTPS